MKILKRLEASYGFEKTFGNLKAVIKNDVLSSSQKKRTVDLFKDGKSLGTYFVNSFCNLKNAPVNLQGEIIKASTVEKIIAWLKESSNNPTDEIQVLSTSEDEEDMLSFIREKINPFLKSNKVDWWLGELLGSRFHSIDARQALRSFLVQFPEFKKEAYKLFPSIK